MTVFLQNCFSGIANGSALALVALGFVIIYRATGVINFAQGGLLGLGAYLTYAYVSAGFPFELAVVAAMVSCALVGVAIERIVLRRMVGQPAFAVIMITIGLLIFINQAITAIWGLKSLNIGDPWGIQTVNAWGVNLGVVDLWTIGLAGAGVVAFFLVFRFSKIGVAMRATAIDQEAALAQGISVRRVFAVSWGISAALATLAGVMLASSSGAASLTPGIGDIALFAFPAMIVGGLDSPIGAVVGGLVIGLTQSLTGFYQDDVFSWAGSDVRSVMPYIVMIAILLARPHGLFGTREVRRV